MGARMTRKSFVDFSQVFQELKTKFETEHQFNQVLQELKTKFELDSTRSRVPFQFHSPCHLGLCDPSV